MSVALPRGFSIYLDLMRFGAALMVLLFHVKSMGLGPAGVLQMIPNRGHDFVILFFVLSGYVIASTADRKRSDGLREFALDRMARVYSVAAPVLIFSTLLALILPTQLDPQRHWPDGIDHPYMTMAANLVFMGQSWQLYITPFMNLPYWSLCYEVMYYAAFACVMFLRGYPRALALLLVLALAGPKILLLMPCWLVGAAAYFFRDRWQLKRASAVLIAFVFPALVLLALHKIGFAPATRALTKGWFGASYEALNFSSDFLIDYVAASLAAVHIYAMRFIGLRWPDRLGSVIKSGAAMSFTLYLFHGPVLSLVLLGYGSKHDGWDAFIVAAAGIPIVCYAISYVTESRRHILRGWLDRWLPGGRRVLSIDPR